MPKEQKIEIKKSKAQTRPKKTANKTANKKLKKVKINAGAGSRARKGFVSCDVRKVQDDYVQCKLWELSNHFEQAITIYSRHVLEHLTFDEVPRTLEDWYTTLMPGGTVHIIVPNMEKHIQQWKDAVWDEKSFASNLSTLGRMRGGLYGWQRESKEDRENSHYWDCHKSGFNETSIKFFLEREGFEKVRTSISANGYHLEAKATKPKHVKKDKPKNDNIIKIQEKAPHPNFIWTSPYGSCHTARCFNVAGVSKYQSSKVVKEKDLINIINSGDLPDLLIMGNFVVDRYALKEIALEAGIDVIHGEDGFIPHYKTLHADPVGFCWESSLPLMSFRGEVDDKHRVKAQSIIDKTAQDKRLKEKRVIDKPYVFFPLQLIGDRVNQYGLNVRDGWLSIAKHARKSIPKDFILAFKTHPRDPKAADIRKWAETQNNVIMLDTGVKLYNVIEHSRGVIGVNSTVLTEARMLFNKPVWAYGDSWFKNHHKLIYRLDSRFSPRGLSREEQLEDGVPDDEFHKNYRLWYLGQLMARQYTQQVAKDKERYKKWLLARTYKSWMMHGESIFKVDGVMQ